MVNTRGINAEILCCMKVVKSHYSYNSCSVFTKNLTKMCPDTDFETKFWKNKMSMCDSLWGGSVL